MPLRNWKTALMWVAGAMSILMGSMIAGRLGLDTGVNELGFLLALAISLMLFLIGGLLWISVALAMRVSKR